jgi:hypothetical protein
LPLTRESARSLPGNWHELTPADVQRSKLTGVLLRAANQLRDKAGGQDVITELAAWDHLRSRLC